MTTTSATRFGRGGCAAVQSGVKLEVRGVRHTTATASMVVAEKVEVKGARQADRSLLAHKVEIDD